MEIVGIVGMSRIESREWLQMTCQIRYLCFQSFYDAAGYLVSAIGIEMGIVCEILCLTWVGACRIVNKSTFRRFYVSIRRNAPFTL